MHAVRPRAIAAVIAIATALLLVGSRWHDAARADEPGGPVLVGKYVRVTFATSPTPGRDGIVTDVLGTAKSVDTVGIHLESEVFVYQNADDANHKLVIFVPWASVLFVTVLPPKTEKD